MPSQLTNDPGIYSNHIAQPSAVAPAVISPETNQPSAKIVDLSAGSRSGQQMPGNPAHSVSHQNVWQKASSAPEIR